MKTMLIAVAVAGCANFNADKFATSLEAGLSNAAQSQRQREQDNAAWYRQTRPAPVVYMTEPPPVASPVVGHLRSQSVSGGLRYCVYSNRVVNTVGQFAQCPLSSQ